MEQLKIEFFQYYFLIYCFYAKKNIFTSRKSFVDKVFTEFSYRLPTYLEERYGVEAGGFCRVHRQMTKPGKKC